MCEYGLLFKICVKINLVSGWVFFGGEGGVIFLIEKNIAIEKEISFLFLSLPTEGSGYGTILLFKM